MLEAYLNMWVNAFTFEGRTSRREYWMAFAVNLVVGLVFGIIAYMLKMPVISNVYNIVTIIPAFTMCVRRMRDIDKSPYWALLNLVPVIGNIWSMVLCARPAYDEANAR